MMFWSCAQTHPHQEALAIRNLRRQHFDAFYPLFLAPNRFRRLAPHPVFPGYVFVQLDSEAYNWAPINSTLGVRRLLTQPAPGDYRRPAKIGFIEDLHHRLRIHNPSAEPEDTLPPGTMVRIRRGPFAERVALVTLSTADRVRLLLEVFNRDTEVEFDRAEVQLIRRPREPLRRAYN